MHFRKILMWHFLFCSFASHHDKSWRADVLLFHYLETCLKVEIEAVKRALETENNLEQDSVDNKEF